MKTGVYTVTLTFFASSILLSRCSCPDVSALGLEEPWLISDTAFLSPSLFLCYYFVLEKFQELILVFWGHSNIALLSVKLTF